MLIQILTYDGFRELDVIGAMEVFALASRAGADLHVQLVRLDSGTVTSASGLNIHVTARIDAVPTAAMLMVPGAGWLAESNAEGWAQQQRHRIAGIVLTAHKEGATLAVTGSGVLFLATAGLLRDRSSTSDRNLLPEVEAAGGRPIEARVVDDGDLVTAGGATAGLDLAIWLVERFATPAVAHAVERQLGYERRGTVWRRPGKAG